MIGKLNARARPLSQDKDRYRARREDIAYLSTDIDQLSPGSVHALLSARCEKGYLSENCASDPC